MKRRILLSLLAVPLAFALGGAGRLAAPVLPEVENHMEQAHRYLGEGNASRAEAHAALVYVGDEVRFTVKYEGVPEEEQNDCRIALNRAFSAWENALDGKLRFRVVDAGEESDVLVRFRPDVRMGREAVAGYVDWRRTMQTEGSKVTERRFSANMQLRTKNLDGRRMSLNAMRHEAAHEIGHVLGLDDCALEGRLMGPLDPDRPLRAPSPEESSTVDNLREDMRAVLDRARALARDR